MNNSLDKAIRLMGGVGRLAASLGVGHNTVSNWKRRGVPVGQCRAIEAATGGKVTRYQLRPDTFGKKP